MVLDQHHCIVLVGVREATLEHEVLRRLKKRAFDETFSRGPVSGLKPRPKPSCSAVSQNCVSYGHLWQSKEDGWTQPGHGWKCGRNHDQVLGVGTGRRMAQPEADRRPLRLRAMPPGRLRRKRRNPHHAGRHNDRAGRCGCVCRLRGAVVGGTGGQRSSMTLSPGKIAQPEAGGSPLGSGVPAPAFAACRPPLLTSWFTG